MLIRKDNLFVILLILFISAYAFSSETDNFTIKIQAHSPEIMVGEPLMLEISISSVAPAIHPKTGEIPVKGEITDTEYLPEDGLVVAVIGPVAKIRGLISSNGFS